MTELAFAKPEYTLSENYNRHLLRHIWRALRDERFNFPKGRIPFAAHIYDTIISTQKKAIYRLENGTLYSIPDGGIDGKTIENFINKCSTIFDLDRASGHKALNTANFTLRYLHLFLWCKQPKRVGKWHSEKRRVIDDLIIKNLDDSFRVFESRKTFPMGIQVLDTSESEHSLLAMSVENHYNNVSASDFKADVIIIESGASISIQTKNFANFSHPEIPKDQCTTVMELRSKLKPKKVYADIQIQELEPVTEFHRDNSSGDLFMAATQTRFSKEDHKSLCLPVHLTQNEAKFLKQICNLMV